MAAASYGGLDAYKTVLAMLPAEFPWPLLVVQHRRPQPDYLVPLLARATRLPVVPAREGVRLEPGTVYVLPADRQGVLERDRRLVFQGAERCQADPLFESAAFVYGERAIGIVLTGRLNDGVAGVRAIKGRGGRVLVQDASTSAVSAMPAAAVATGCVDFVLPLRYIAPALVSLVVVPGAAELFRVRLSPWALAGSG